MITYENVGVEHCGCSRNRFEWVGGLKLQPIPKHGWTVANKCRWVKPTTRRTGLNWVPQCWTHKSSQNWATLAIPNGHRFSSNPHCFFQLESMRQVGSSFHLLNGTKRNVWIWNHQPCMILSWRIILRPSSHFFTHARRLSQLAEPVGEDCHPSQDGSCHYETPFPCDGRDIAETCVTISARGACSLGKWWESESNGMGIPIFRQNYIRVLDQEVPAAGS